MGYHRILFNFSVLGLFLVYVFLSSVSFAKGGIDLKTIKSLKEIELMPVEEFNEKTKLVEEIPFDDEFLAYSIRLPKDWEINTEPFVKSLDKVGQSNNRVIGIVSSYISPPKQHQRSRFTLEALSLDYEIGVRDWFINHILSSGKSLEGISDEKDNRIDAIYVEVQKDTTYYVRVAAVINGPRVFIARYYIAQELYKDEGVFQAQVINSFRLTNKEKGGIEGRKVFGFLGQSYFDYLNSWQLQTEQPKSIDRMKARLSRSVRPGYIDGEINIHLTNKAIGATKVSTLAFFKDKLSIPDYELGPYIETWDMNYHGDMSFGATEIYEMNPTAPQMLEYELWVSLMESDDYYYVISLLTPKRTEDFYEWARNAKAYKIVVANMRRYDEGLHYYEFIK